MRNELKLLFYLKRKEVKTDGTIPIMGRITIGKSMVQFSAKCSVKESLWDDKSGRAVGKSKIAKELNHTLNKISVSINMHYRNLSERKSEITAPEIKSAFQGSAQGQATLLEFFANHNNDFKLKVGTSRRVATYDRYCNSLRLLSIFVHEKTKLSDISFRQLDYSFIERYDFFLRVELMRMPNTVLGAVTHLRKMIRLAVDKDIIERDPFAGYTPERPKIKPKFLPREDLQKVMTTPLDHPSRYLTRDMFIFSCFTGISVGDMCELTQQNISKAEDGVLWINIKRKKTGTPCSIPLLELPLQIIEKYRGATKNNKLLPMLSCSKLNLNLKKIGTICGIEQRLNFHMGRHIFASVTCLSQGIPIESVSRMLGHRDLRSTQIYAQITNDKIESDMKILQSRIETKYQFNYENK